MCCQRIDNQNSTTTNEAYKMVKKAKSKKSTVRVRELKPRKNAKGGSTASSALIRACATGKHIDKTIIAI
jgi:hypothetical protein